MHNVDTTQKNITSEDMIYILTLHNPQTAKEASAQFIRETLFSSGSFLASSMEDVFCEVDFNPLTRKGWSQACRSRRSITNMLT